MWFRGDPSLPDPFLIVYPGLSIGTRLCYVDEWPDIKCVELEPAPPGLHGVYAVIVIIKFYIEEPLEKIERDYEACLCVWERTDWTLWKQVFVSGLGDWSERKYLIRSKCFFKKCVTSKHFLSVLSFIHATCKDFAGIYIFKKRPRVRPRLLSQAASPLRRCTKTINRPKSKLNMLLRKADMTINSDLKINWACCFGLPFAVSQCVVAVWPKVLLAVCVHWITFRHVELPLLQQSLPFCTAKTTPAPPKYTRVRIKTFCPV